MAAASEYPGPVLDLRGLGGAMSSQRALERAETLLPGGVAVLLLPPGLPVRLLSRLSALGMMVRLDRLASGFRLNIRRPDVALMEHLRRR